MNIRVDFSCFKIDMLPRLGSAEIRGFIHTRAFTIFLIREKKGGKKKPKG